MKSKIKIIDGKQIEYFQYGNSNNPPLLFIHGFHGDAHEISSISQYLAKIFCVYSPNLPGFGASHELGLNFNIDNCVRILSKFVNSLGLKNLYLGGVSLGGSIAARMSFTKVGKTNGLVLLHPLYCGNHLKINPSNRKKILNFLSFCQNQIISNTLVPFIYKKDLLLKLFLKKFSDKKLSAQELITRIRCIRTCTPKTYISGLKALLTYSPPKSKTQNHKMLLFLNPIDSVIDPQKTYFSYKKLFPKTRKLDLIMENHHPEIIPTVAELQAKYPQILDEIKNWL